MSFPIFQVDAFTHIPFRGNPAAVVILDKMQPDGWLRNVAAEMNLSETAFVAPNTDPFKRVWQLRWFTPTTEVELCGHATLASAHVMFSEGYAKPQETIRFDTLSGELQASKDPGGWIELTFPTSPTEPVTLGTIGVSGASIEEILGAEAVAIHKATFEEDFDYLIELKSADLVRALTPNIQALSKLGSRAVTITAQATKEDNGAPDFASRVFAPNVGVLEDPVTGSAHCYLSYYWAQKLGKTEFTAHQVSERGGTLKVKLLGERTTIAGRGVSILKGKLLK